LTCFDISHYDTLDLASGLAVEPACGAHLAFLDRETNELRD
jgi:hypothetical protein